MPTAQKAAAPSPPEPIYPAIEAFIESASADDIARLFAQLKDGLTALKGPKAEQSRKVQVAVDRTEELLRHLLQVREQVVADAKGAKPRK